MDGAATDIPRGERYASEWPLRNNATYRFSAQSFRPSDAASRSVDRSSIEDAVADNICLDHGLLVGMRDRLPIDEREYYRVKGQIVGCNRVFCRCQCWVKHLDGYRIWGEPLSRAEHERLYATLDPKIFDVFMADPELFRTYVCRCNWADTSGIKRLEGGDIDGWSCAGHPGP